MKTIGKLSAQLRTISILNGPSEKDLMRATYFDRFYPLKFSGHDAGDYLECMMTAVFPLSMDHQQYCLIVKGVRIIDGYYHTVYFDTKRRLGSRIENPVRLPIAFQLVDDIGLTLCPFATGSRFDGRVLECLAESSKCVLAYDDLRKRTRIHRGLPEIVLLLERDGRVLCSRDDDGKIKVVALPHRELA